MVDDDDAPCNCPSQMRWNLRKKLYFMTPEEKRQAVVKEALSWVRTPFVHQQCVKGVAADCSTFIAACYRAVGIFRADIPTLQADWFMHTTKQSYLEELQRHATEFSLVDHEPQPGDILLVKDVAIGSKVYSHGAIVLNWGAQPQVIHCFPPSVMTSYVRRFPAFVGKNLRFFDPFGVTNA